MKKTAVEVYALAVCFFAAAVFAVSAAAAVWDVVEWAAPEFAMDGRDYECHQSDDAFQSCYERGDIGFYRRETPAPLPDGAALTTTREESFSRQINAGRRNAIKDLAQKGILCVMMMILFAAHWRLRRLAYHNNKD